MAQRLYEVADLPDSAVEASAVFAADHLNAARRAIGEGVDSLVIVLPPAASDHKDWRIALARDLARAHVPARINVISGPSDEGRAALLHYLDNAKGVTGHYLETHD